MKHALLLPVLVSLIFVLDKVPLQQQNASKAADDSQNAKDPQSNSKPVAVVKELKEQNVKLQQAQAPPKNSHTRTKGP